MWEININFPFLMTQIDVLTKKVEKLKEIDFLIINLINAANEGCIPKDLNLSETLKKYYNLDDKFNTFFYDYIHILLENGTLKIKENVSWEKDNIWECFNKKMLGDFYINERIRKSFNDNSYFSFVKKIDKIWNTINYYPINYEKPDYDFEMCDSIYKPYYDCDLLDKSKYILEEDHECLKNAAIDYISKKIDQGIEIYDSQIIKQDIVLIKLPCIFYFNKNTQNNLIEIRPKNKNANIALTNFINKDEKFLKLKDEIIDYLKESILLNIDNDNTSCDEIENNINAFDEKTLNSIKLALKDTQDLFNNSLSKIILFQNKLHKLFINDIKYLIICDENKHEFEYKELVLSRPLKSDDKVLFELLKDLIDSIKLGKFKFEKLRDIECKLLNDKVEESVNNIIDKCDDWSFIFDNNNLSNYILNNKNLIDVLYEKINDNYLLINLNLKNKLMEKLFNIDKINKKFLLSCKNNWLNDENQRFIWEKYELNFDGKTKYFSNSEVENNAFEIYKLYQSILKINPSDKSKDGDKYEEDFINVKSKFDNLNKKESWMDISQLLNNFEEKLNELEMPLINDYENKNMKLAKELRIIIELNLSKNGYDKEDIHRKKYNILEELGLTKEDIEIIKKIMDICNPYFHYSKVLLEKQIKKLKSDYEILISSKKTIENIIKKCKVNKEVSKNES